MVALAASVAMIVCATIAMAGPATPSPAAKASPAARPSAGAGQRPDADAAQRTPSRLRWVAGNALLTLDPHATNQAPTSTLLNHVYEGLTRFDAALQIEPALARSWTMVSDTEWRFELRPGVRFHEGQPLTPGDVVFSIERVRAAGGSIAASLSAIDGVRRDGDDAVVITLDRPTPLLPRLLVDVRIASEAWAGQHDAEHAQDLKAAETGYAARHANGTGPYRIDEWTSESAATLQRWPGWWDGDTPALVDTIDFSADPLPQARLAALEAGDVDIVTDVPVDELPRLRSNRALRIVQGADTRTLFIGMDQASPELKFGPDGPNPLRDERVRRALWLAIDTDAIRDRVTHDMTMPAGTLVSPPIQGWSTELDQRPAADPAAARRLLAEAGYPRGFAFTFDCPNNRYLYDEATCRAVTAMWQAVGLSPRLNLMPFANYIPKIEARDTSVWLLGWTPTAFDALNTLQAVAHTPGNGASGGPAGTGSEGDYNIGRISDTKLDALIDAARVENDGPRRTQLLREALERIRDRVYYVPLHHPMRAWAMRAGVRGEHRPDDRFDARYVRVNPVAVTRRERAR